MNYICSFTFSTSHIRKVKTSEINVKTTWGIFDCGSGGRKGVSNGGKGGTTITEQQ